MPFNKELLPIPEGVIGNVLVRLGSLSTQNLFEEDLRKTDGGVMDG